MNRIFVFLVLIAFIVTGWQQWHWQPTDLNTIAPMQAMTDQILLTANDAVSLAISLIGVLCFFLGLMRVIEAAGLLKLLATGLHPIFSKLFPDVPAQHPAMGAIVMNMSANILGLGNAATPFGIKAMQGLNTLNQTPGVASDAMILFLAINTSSITLLPIKVIALRTGAHSADPTAIIATTLFATLCSTLVAILVAKLMARWCQRNTPRPDTLRTPFKLSTLLILVSFVSLLPLTLLYGAIIGPWVIPTLFASIIVYGMVKGINVYEQFVEGAKEGFSVAINIMPYLVTILVAIGMIRVSGALDAIITGLAPLTGRIGLPAEVLPMALMRPLSGSGSLGILAEIINNPTIGPDSYIGQLASTLMGSTETTFYVLAVYFGSVQIKKLRYALVPALMADVTAVLASVFIVKILLC